MNILVVHNHYQIAGGEDSVVNNEINMLKENGHKVVLYERHNDEIKDFNLFKKLLLPFTTIYSLKTSKEIKEIIKKENIDIVHVHNTLPLISQSVYYSATKLKVPVVQTVHNFRFICPNALLYREGNICEECLSKGLKCAIKHKCYRNNKLQTLLCVINMKIHRMTGIYKKINFICLTEFNKQKLLNLKQVNEKQIFIKPNFVEDYNGPIIEYKNRKNQYIYVGRLDETKGIKVLFEAWKNVNNEIKLLVFGNGPLMEWCNKYIKENNITNIEMKGFQKQDIIKKELSESKALIMPTQWYEGFPMVILESISVKTPIIGSDIGNVGSIITEDIGVKYKSIEQLKNIIENISNNVMFYYAENLYYTKSNNYKKLISIYNKLASER